MYIRSASSPSTVLWAFHTIQPSSYSCDMSPDSSFTERAYKHTHTHTHTHRQLTDCTIRGRYGLHVSKRLAAGFPLIICDSLHPSILYGCVDVADQAQALDDINSRSGLCCHYSAPQCSHCKRCISYSNSVSLRLSVTRRYSVKTTARSTVQFALLDSKMCLVL